MPGHCLHGGGEPLLRDDYFDIHRCAHERGFFVSLFTNGVLLDERAADQLAACPPRAVEISLYGGDEETYAAVTGCRGSFEKVAAAVELLQARSIDVILKSVLLAPIVDRIEPLLAFAAAHHLNPVFDPAVTPTVDGDPAPVRLRDNPERVVDIEFCAPGSAERLQRYHNRIMASPPAAGDPLCGAGFYGFHIDFRGSLMKCLMLRSPSHSLLDMSFAQAWDRLGETERPVFPAETECHHCGYKHLCACCPGALYCGEGPPGGKDSFYCRVAAARMEKIRSGEGERSPQ